MSRPIYVIEPILPPVQVFQKHMEDIFANGVLANNGPKVRTLEKELATFLNVPHVVACANGTQGLEIAIHAANAAGSRIITTPFTYVATLSATLWVGCDPVFCDIDEETLALDVKCLARLMNKDIRAILPVDVYGHPCDFGAIGEIAGDVPVIYDAAQAFGATLNGESLFNFGSLAICSMHATKSFNTFEGGFIVCHSQEDYNKLNLLRAYGHIGDEHYCLGINAKMSEAHAAMGLSLLDYFEAHRAGRKLINDLYDSLLDFMHLRKPTVPPGFSSNYGYYPVIFQDEATLLKSMEALHKNNIFPRRYFYPSLTRLPYVKGQSCPVAESIAPRVLCLPIFSGLKTEEAENIARIVNSAVHGI